MKVPRFLIFIIISGIFQATLLDYFRVLGAKPDLLLITVYISALFFDFKSVLGFSLFAGILKDSFLLSTIGFNTALFPILAILIMRIIREVSIEDNISRSLFLFVVALLSNVLSGLILVYSNGFVPLGIFLRITFLASVYTASVFPLLLKLVKR
jgi:rod shape-determining protein MreD